MNQVFQWLRLDELPTGLAVGILLFYVLFLVWVVSTVRSWWRRGRAETTNLDAATAPRRTTPAFARENVAEKAEAVRRAEAYRTPSERAAEAAAAAAVASRRGGFLDWLTTVAGVLSLLLGLAFVALLAYGLIVQPKGTDGIAKWFSHDAAQTLLATHWLVILFTLIRTGGAVAKLRSSRRVRTSAA